MKRGDIVNIKNTPGTEIYVKNCLILDICVFSDLKDEEKFHAYADMLSVSRDHLELDLTTNMTVVKLLRPQGDIVWASTQNLTQVFPC